MKKQIARTRALGEEKVRQSALTAIKNNAEVQFSSDMGGQDAAAVMMHNTTGQRDDMLNTQVLSSDPGDKGPVYKFKNIHGDRGTYAGLSSQAQNQPPSSMWRDHPQIPQHLMEPKI